MIPETDRSGILTVQITVVTSWTTAVLSIAVSDPAIEAVVVVIIADLIESDALCIGYALRHANVGICIAVIAIIAISIVPTSTDVRVSITDRSGVLTVEVAVMASLATSIV